MLKKEHSRAQADRIISYIGDDQEKFEQLMSLFFDGEPLIVQRSAWPVGIICSQNPSLFLPYLEKSMVYLQNPHVHDAVYRNLLKILMEIEIPEDFQAIIVDICLNFITIQNGPSGIKAFAIGILQEICKVHPELSLEIKYVLKERMEFEKSAFKSRANQFFKEMEKREKQRQTKLSKV